MSLRGKTIEYVKMKSIAKAKAHALEIAQNAREIILQKEKLEKRQKMIENVKVKSIAKAKAHA